MAKKSVESGASTNGRGAARVLSAEDVAAAEAAFPYIDISSKTGQWVAEQLASGVKKIDILTTLDRGRVPGTQED